ncbi:adenylate/guanylate cyclase domain-containing protein [Roseateles sp. BYS180W]|uniref:Adenylate/guanylate cyclase domain-containing protein n=1 Tax=Roseateles rivi TaxID=3299028 RepID=A0ABW7FVP2_9BURK
MSQIRERTVLFADLRGSTGLFESLGNAHASDLVTGAVSLVSRAIPSYGGTLVKTLGDGLMAVFPQPNDGVRAAIRMQELLRQSQALSPNAGHVLRLQVALSRGEVVEIGSDCFGDAVNVSARLLDHAGDGETLVTAEVLQGLPSSMQGHFRSLDRISVRGRIEPVRLYMLESSQRDAAVTQFGADARLHNEPDAIRLSWQDVNRTYDIGQIPIILGRSSQATYCVTDVRVSRSHARIDWHGGNFSITDLSYNGSFVRFGSGEVIGLRRSSCTLHGSGVIGLGRPPSDPQAPVVHFEVMHFAETVPANLAHSRALRSD